MDDITRIQRYFARKALSGNTNGEPCAGQTRSHGSGSSVGETQVMLCAPALTSHIYRLWRDDGYAVEAPLARLLADVLSASRSPLPPLGGNFSIRRGRRQDDA